MHICLSGKLKNFHMVHFKMLKMGLLDLRGFWQVCYRIGVLQLAGLNGGEVVSL